VTCRLGKRDLSNVLASILNGPDEAQEKPVVPTTAYSLVSALCCRSSPPREPRNATQADAPRTNADLSKFYGANEAKMPQSVVFRAQDEEFV